jgi:hypothetical protein
MADIDWKPLPTGLWTPPAVFAEMENLFLQAFTDDGVPTWEISKKTGERGEWKVISKGTADSFEAAEDGGALRSGSIIHDRRPTEGRWTMAIFKFSLPIQYTGSASF